MHSIFPSLDPNLVAAWSDIISMMLLGMNILVGGIDPAHRWGRSIFRNVLILLCLTASISFTVFRFVYGGVNRNAGSREFLAGSAIYSARWIWLWYNMARRATRSGRMYRVGQALMLLQTLQVRKSTHKNEERIGRNELIIRCGSRRLPGKSEEYLGGYDRTEPVWHEHVQTWEVHLVEGNLHGDKLYALGTMEYNQMDPYPVDGVFKRIYNVVMSTTERRDAITVDYSKFEANWSPLRVIQIAERVGAVHDTPLGGVARRIAADACLFIIGNTVPETRKRAEFRTRMQVDCLNACLRQAAKDYLEKGWRPTMPL